MLETLKSYSVPKEGTMAPTPNDKLRLLLVFYLSSPDGAIPKDDMKELENELQKAGCDIRALEYVKRYTRPSDVMFLMINFWHV
jgi:hypothetical protein